jgi:hypothetical protein
VPTQLARIPGVVSKEYDTSKGTIRFQPDKPMLAAIARKPVKAWIAENNE